MNQIPARLGPYRLERELARGGMGAVYLAVDEQGQRVALKTCLRVTAEAHQRMQREVNALQQVVHGNVVRLLDEGPGPPPWLAMELIEGQDLAQLVRTRRLTPSEVLRLLDELADALHALHAQGIVHRDLKPENVMLRAGDGSAVLCDFGINRGLGDQTLTRTGAVVGTLDFMAPEQLEGQRAGPPADVWGVGAILYWLINDRAPNHVGQRTLDPQRTPPHSLALLQGLCDRCLADDPQRRPSAAELREEVRLLRAPPRAGRTPPRTLAPGLALGACLAGGIALAVWLGGPSPASEGAAALPAQEALDPAADVVAWTRSESPDPAHLEPTDPRQWPLPGVVAPLEAPRASFAGEVSEQGDGSLRVSYAVDELPLREARPSRFRAITGGARARWIGSGGMIGLDVPFDTGYLVVPLGDAAWNPGTLEFDVLGAEDQNQNRGELWAGLAPFERERGALIQVSRRGGRGSRVLLDEAELPLRGERASLRLAPHESPWVRLAEEELADPDPDTRPRSGRFALVVLSGRWVFPEQAVVSGRPLRVDRPGVARLPEDAPVEARLVARLAGASNAAAGPFLGATARDGSWVRLEARASELLLYSGPNLLARAPREGDASQPLELSLRRRGVELLGAARQGRGVARLRGVWPRAGVGPLRWELGSTGPRAELLELRQDGRDVSLPPELERYAELTQDVARLLRPENPEPTTRVDRARLAGEALEALVPSLSSELAADALARAVYCACVRGSGDLAARLCARLRDDYGAATARRTLAALDDDRASGFDLVWQLHRFAPGFKGDTVARADAGQRVLQVLAGASPEDLEASARFLRLLTQLRSGTADLRELERALERAPNANPNQRAEALAGLGRLPEALQLVEAAGTWRRDWFAARTRASILLGLGREPEALEAYLYSLGRLPRPSIAQGFFRPRASTTVLTTRLRGSHPGLAAVADLTRGRVLELPDAERQRLVRASAYLPSAAPRQRDLQAFAAASVDLPYELPRADRPTAVLVRAFSGNDEARAELRAAAKADDLVHALALIDPTLRPFVRAE